MAKDKDRPKDDDNLDPEAIGDGTDEAVKEAQPVVAPIANLFKSRLVKILGYALIAVMLIVVSVLISKVVVEKAGGPGRLNVQDQRWEEKKPDPLAAFTLSEFKLNTADMDETHFIKVTVYLAYADPKKKKENTELVAELNERKIQLVDLVTKILMSKTKADVASIEQQANLKEEIKGRINELLVKGEIEDVYFTDFSVI
jgi:flagellar protein FliL